MYSSTFLSFPPHRTLPVPECHSEPAAVPQQPHPLFQLCPALPLLRDQRRGNPGADHPVSDRVTLRTGNRTSLFKVSETVCISVSGSQVSRMDIKLPSLFSCSVLLERLIVNRPHPWGLLITFIELIKNQTYNFWKHDFVHCAPEIEK